MNNSVVLKAISEYAQKNNITVICLGDPNQNTARLNYEEWGKKTEGSEREYLGKNGNSYDGYEDCVYLKTPYLTANFRSDYRSKVDNYTSLLTTLNLVTDTIIAGEKVDPELQDYIKALKDILNGSKISLKYYRSKDMIYGDRITTNEEDFKAVLKKTMASGASILLVTDNTTNGKYISDEFKETDKFKKQTTEEAQGGEYDFIFIDKAVEPKGETSDIYGKLKDLYTMTQRSRKGSIILDTDDNYSDLFQSDSDPSSMGKWEMSSEQKAEYEKWRLEPLKALTPSDDYEVNTTFKEVPEPEEKPKPEPEPEPAPESEPKPGDEEKPAAEPTKPAEVNPETPAEPEETPAIPAEEHPAEETPATSNPAIPLAETKLKTPKAETIVIEEELEDWDRKSEETSTNEEAPRPEEVPQGSFPASNYFNAVFTPEFFEAQKKDENSLFNYLKTNGLVMSKEDYQKLIM